MASFIFTRGFQYLLWSSYSNLLKGFDIYGSKRILGET